jgi:hypothetical protein
MCYTIYINVQIYIMLSKIEENKVEIYLSKKP